MSSCVVPSIESIITGAIDFEGSSINFIGNVSFEGNHAVATVGKGQLEDYLQAIQGVV